MLCIHCKKSSEILRPSFLSMAAMTAWATIAEAQTPQVGDTQVVSAISVSLHVSSTGKESKQASYTPPPGWYVRRHYVTCNEMYGLTSYSVGTVPSGWSSSSDARVNTASENRLDFAAYLWKLPVQGKLDLRSNDNVRERFTSNSNQHALVLTASVNGEGLFRRGAGLELNVMAELVYVGLTPTVMPYRPALGDPISIQVAVGN